MGRRRPRRRPASAPAPVSAAVPVSTAVPVSAPAPLAARRVVALRPVQAQRLVGGHEHPGVQLRVPARDGGRVGPEGVLQRAERLVAQLVAIDEEERPAQEAGVGEAAQEVDRDVRLARAGRQAQQGALLAAGDLLEDGADGGVLVVASARLAAAVGGAERAGQLRAQVQAASRLPAHAELVRGGEARHRGGLRREAGRGVVPHPLVAVRAVNEGHVQAGRAPRVLPRVLLRLVDPARGRRVRALRLHHRDGDRLRVRRDLDPERVVGASGSGAPWPPVHDLDRPGRLLAPDQLLGPAGGVEGRIKERGAGVRLELGHVLNASDRTGTCGRRRDVPAAVCIRGRAAPRRQGGRKGGRRARGPAAPRGTF